MQATVVKRSSEVLTPGEIVKIEAEYKAHYVCDTSIKQSSGWAGPVALFWQETPPVEGYSNYFAIIHLNGGEYITSGQSAVDEPMVGLMDKKTGVVVFSTHRHDFVWLPSTAGAIDGGRDYCKITGDFSEIDTVQITFDGPNLIVSPFPDEMSDD